MSSAIASLFLLHSTYETYQDNKSISDAAYQDYFSATSNIQEYARIYYDAYTTANNSMDDMIGPAVVLGSIWFWNILDLNQVVKKHKKIYFNLKMNNVKVGIGF